MIYEVMCKRRSVRRFKETMPSREELEKLIESAITAPSAGNRQLWRFIIVQDKEIILKVCEEVDMAREKIIPMLEDDFQENFENYSKSFRIFKNAPAMIVVIYKPSSTLADSLRQDAPAEMRNNLLGLGRDGSLISASLATQNIMLTAVEMELGTCCMTGPVIAGDNLKMCLKVPNGWEIAVLLPVGYPDDEPKEKDKKSVNSFIKWI